MGRAHAELAGEAPGGLGNALYALQQQARRQRHVEENVGQQDAEQAIKVIAGASPSPCSNCGNQPCLPCTATMPKMAMMTGKTSERPNSLSSRRRPMKRRRARARATGMASPRLSSGEQRLPEAEAQHVAQVGVGQQGAGRQCPGLPQQAASGPRRAAE